MVIRLCWQKWRNVSQGLTGHGSYHLIRNKRFSHMKILTIKSSMWSIQCFSWWGLISTYKVLEVRLGCSSFLLVAKFAMDHCWIIQVTWYSHFWISLFSNPFTAVPTTKSPHNLLIYSWLCPGLVSNILIQGCNSQSIFHSFSALVFSVFISSPANHAWVSYTAAKSNK